MPRLIPTFRKRLSSSPRVSQIVVSVPENFKRQCIPSHFMGAMFQLQELGKVGVDKWRCGVGHPWQDMVRHKGANTLSMACPKPEHGHDRSLFQNASMVTELAISRPVDRQRLEGSSAACQYKQVRVFSQNCVTDTFLPVWQTKPRVSHLSQPTYVTVNQIYHQWSENCSFNQKFIGSFSWWSQLYSRNPFLE